MPLSSRRLAAWLRRGRAEDTRPASASGLLERAIAAYRAREWGAAEPLFWAVIAASDAPPGDRQVARNILCAQYVRTRRLAEAIELFEANVAEGSGGNYPFERLAEIYARQQRVADAARVLRRAIVEFGAQPDASGDRATRLARLRAALTEVEARLPPAEPER